MFDICFVFALKNEIYLINALKYNKSHVTSDSGRSQWDKEYE
jgi:hypothetical protein